MRRDDFRLERRAAAADAGRKRAPIRFGLIGEAAERDADCGSVTSVNRRRFQRLRDCVRAVRRR